MQSELIIPYVYNSKKDKRIIYNENEYFNILDKIKLLATKLHIENKMEISRSKLVEQIVNLGDKKNHFLGVLPSGFKLKFINIDKIPNNYTIEQIANNLK